MAEVGLLAPDARVELIEGEIFDMPPIGYRHTGLTSALHGRVARELAGKACAWNQGTLQLSEFSAPQPDLVLLTYRQDEYCGGPPPSPDDVLLIVEVSENSYRHDRDVKLPLYARHNIPEVWIVEVERPSIHVFHTLRAGHYTHAASTPAPARVTLQALPGLSVDLTGLLDKLG